MRGSKRCSRLSAHLGAVVALSLASAAVAEAVPANVADGRLDRALRELVEMDLGPVGAISLIQRDGRWSAHRTGAKDLDTGRPIGWRDHMRIASVAKAYSGAVALALVDRGVLSLDDTIGDRLPALPDDWSGVTLRQLLSHTSGLPDYTQAQEFQDDVNEDPLRYFAPGELLPYVYDEDLVFPSGTEYAYSNSDNIAVALMAEVATGEPYQDLLQRSVYDRIRVRDTSLPITPELPFPFLHGYFYEDTGPLDVSELINPSGAWASGGIVATPADLNKFIRGLLGRRYFGRHTQEEQLDFFPGGMSDPPGPGENSAGLGIFRYETECGVVYGHTGSFPGYTQFAAASRDGSRSATVSVNLQLTPEIDPVVFDQLHRTFELAVCAALAPVRTGVRGALP